MRYATVALVAVALLQSYTLAQEFGDRAALAPVLGKRYELYSSENFEEFMKELGIGWFTRKRYSLARPIIELNENDGVYTLTYESFFKDATLVFRIGQEFTERTPDGRYVRTIITQQGNVLTQVQKGKKTTTIVRTFTPKEVKAVARVGNVVTTRIYKAL